MAPRSYSTAVQAAGAVALLLPADPAVPQDPAPLLERIDGLILAGGSDVEPGTYGADRHPETKSTWPDRDRFELALTRRALDRGMPVLGICRGMQLLNVALGGTLDQHLPDAIGHEDHRHTPGGFGDHEVRLEPESLAARAAGAERIVVKSHHHQGVERVGEGLVVSGWSTDDEVDRGDRVARRVLRPRRPLAPGGGRREPGDRRAGGSSPKGGSRREPCSSRARHGAGDGRDPTGRGRRRSTRRSQPRRPPSPPGGRSPPATERRCCTGSPTLLDRALRGAGQAGGAQRRQADLRRPRRDGDGRADLPLLRGGGRAAARADDPGGRRNRHDLPRAARRRRADRSLELPPGDRLLEGGAGAGGGQHDRAEAGRADPADRARAGEDRARRGDPRGRPQRRRRPGERLRQAAWSSTPTSPRSPSPAPPRSAGASPPAPRRRSSG